MDMEELISINLALPFNFEYMEWHVNFNLALHLYLSFSYLDLGSFCI